MNAISVLRTLTNENLLASVVRLATEERRITLAVLEHFREIERRKAYADLGYRSLFDYAVKHLRYSEPSASRRIAAMHALRAHPELARPLSSGAATVTNVAKIATTLRREERASGRKMNTEEKKTLFREMSVLPARELERKLVRMAPRSALTERARPVTAELRELRIFLAEGVFAELEELMALRGRTLANPGSYSELFGELIQAAKRAHLEKFSEKSRRRASPLAGGTRMKDAEPEKARAVQAISEESSASKNSPREPGQESANDRAAPPNSPRPSIQSRDPIRTRTVPAAIRRAVFRRAGFRCEFIEKTGNPCGSRRNLEVEHRTPYARGGPNEITNLELLCRDHNQIRGIRTFGPDRMKRS